MTKGTVDRASWAKGTKLALLESRKAQWTDAKDANNIGLFYDQTAQMILQQYGFDLNYDEDGPILAPASESTCAKVLQFSDDMPDEERKRRLKLYRTLRVKLGNWYRYHMTTVNSGKGRTRSQVDDFLEAFNDISSVCPRRQSAMSLYSSRFFNSRIKPAVEAEWSAKSEEERAVRGARLLLGNQQTKIFWNNKPEEFRQALQEECEQKYQDAMDQYRNGQAWTPKTAEEYHEAITEGHKVLLPLVNALAQYYGMAASILLCGPLADGKIKTKGGRTMKIWPNADKEGFELVEKLFINYGVKLFTKEEIESQKVDFSGGKESSPEAGSAALLQQSQTTPASKTATEPGNNAGSLSESEIPIDPVLATPTPPADYIAQPTQANPSDPSDLSPAIARATLLTENSTQDPSNPSDPSDPSPSIARATSPAHNSTQNPSNPSNPSDPSPSVARTTSPTHNSTQASDEEPKAVEPPILSSASSALLSAQTDALPQLENARSLSPVEQAISQVVVPPTGNADLDLEKLIPENSKKLIRKSFEWLQSKAWGTEWDVCVRGLIRAEAWLSYQGEADKST
ncbi:hypothetical protein H0H92_003735 [Tricholoma furcatifolium]|nr:hypothetical protein H0H92_003735 [Tricholoma furcatifolium]